jgi:hypoxia up-regulated 1
MYFHSRLRLVDNFENIKRRREEARNNLETYLYRLRDLLEDPSDAPFWKCSKSDERSAISSKLDETMSWMHDMADEVYTPQFLEKLSGLE